MNRTMKIAASIMCADILNLQKDIETLQKCGVEYLHLDVMDGHFVNNITLGFDCCVKVKKYHIPRDIHLLVDFPFKYISGLSLQQDDICQCHYESNADFRKIAKTVHQSGAKFGMVLNPETAIEVTAPYLQDTDVVTLMMIEPGFAGYPMENGMLEKISYARRWLDKQKSNILLEVDGHVTTRNAPIMYKNGAEIFVAGTSSVFRPDISICDGIKALRMCADE